MESSNFFLGIAPLVVFVILDSFMSLKIALMSAILLAILEAIYTYINFGSLDLVTGFSLLLVSTLGALSYYKEDSIYFKYSPAILSTVMCFYFLFTYFIDEPLFVVMVEKYGSLFSDSQREMFKLPLMQRLLKMSTLTSGVGLFFHGIVTAYAAKKLSNIWWLVCRGVGFYVFLFISFICARILV